MCGIAGIYRRGDAPVPEGRLLAMRDAQTHRGPDAVGLHVAPHIGLAFNRLAIIDLSPAANQPMLSEDGSIAIIFNGEIYNFQEIRARLEAKGRRFRTKSDTEVILQGYQQWGIEVVRELNGMFAIALWDARREVLHLVRDRVGKKPLFYRDAGGEIVFASEVRALVRGLDSTPPLDEQALDLYLTYLTVPGDRSIYAGVRKVPPGVIVTAGRDGLRVETYWRLSYARKRSLCEGEALAELDDLLADATRLRMISDVPLGAFLSGGVDSSTVVALMSRLAGPVRTFSIGFADARYNELPHARAVAEACGTRHTEIMVEPQAAAVLPRLVWHYGEPFADSSAVPTWYVSEAARREVTVALNGDGGDEAFAGYSWHRSLRASETYRKAVPEMLRLRVLAPLGRAAARLPGRPEGLASLARFLDRWGGRPIEESFWIWAGVGGGGDRAGLYDPEFLRRLSRFDPIDYGRTALRRADGRTDADRGLQVGFETYLPDDLLVKVDIASMAHALEARSPLLDYRVMEFAAGLPAALLLKRYRCKHLLKTYAAHLVPRSVLDRPKQGFAVPLALWLRGPLRRPLEALITDRRFAARRLLRPPAVRWLLDRHIAGEDHAFLLWAILWLELWFRMFVDGDLRRDDSLADLV